MSRKEFIPQHKPEKISPRDDVIVLLPSIKKVLYDTCYSKLIVDTKLEMVGKLTDEEIAKDNILKNVVRSLAINLQREGELSSEKGLFAGITNSIPEDKLKEWARPGKRDSWVIPFYEEANYFLKKGKQELDPSFRLKNILRKTALLLTRQEREAVFDLCYSDLLLNTGKEVDGTLMECEVVRNDTLRKVLKSLAVGLGKDKKLLPLAWLEVGVTEYIQENRVQQLAKPGRKNPSMLNKAAKYFLEKKMKQSKNQNESR
jgi:hypothetical protein